jgi:hypothetical protein
LCRPYSRDWPEQHLLTSAHLSSCVHLSTPGSGLVAIQVF